MSTIKSDTADLTLNADGASSSLKLQIDGVEKASVSTAGAFTSTSIDATKLTGALPAISGASLTGISTDLVGDTTPQLGGDLASNGNDINLADNDKIQCGASQDLRFYHDGIDSHIYNTTGTTYIRNTNSPIVLQAKDGEASVICIADAEVELRHNNSTKLVTQAGGVGITGTLAATAVTGDGSGLTNLPSSNKVLQVVSYGPWIPGGNGSINTNSTSYVNSGIPTSHIQTIKANSKIIVQYSGWIAHLNTQNNNSICIATFYRSHDNASWTKCGESETGGYMIYEYDTNTNIWFDMPGRLFMSYPGGAASTHHYFQLRIKRPNVNSPGNMGHLHHGGGMHAQEDTTITMNLMEVEV